ncbi:MAG: hypothetical protein CM15mV38_1380 [uncultured marine virus]|nr:MAG: hypothetical protein CM15mV38_1380 [uncultured marine virus]
MSSKPSRNRLLYRWNSNNSWSGNSTTIDQITTPMEDPNTAYNTDNSSTGGAYSANSTINICRSFNYVDTTGPMMQII